ncbi:hypothetical protein ATANTOWER_022196 [Ataeniobius toweri]|uniref:Uncharacterized protein n=1 Tax=Ataeniobius toweri TaxID=208326 RepID=A0ABU7CCS4_9TELE|nr:hypothetical protein [Ataeniobius toweri]
MVTFPFSHTNTPTSSSTLPLFFLTLRLSTERAAAGSPAPSGYCNAAQSPLEKVDITPSGRSWKDFLERKGDH